jgi:Crk-Associated Substrate C-terminal domain
LQPAAPVDGSNHQFGSTLGQHTVPPAASLPNADVPPSKPTVVTSPTASSSTNHNSTELDLSQSHENIDSTDEHSHNTDNATRTISIATQDSLDHILAHLMNDISSPSFQRSSTVSNTKTDENMNIRDKAMPSFDGDVNLSPCSDDINVFESDSNGDYDVPCGASDEAIDQHDSDVCHTILSSPPVSGTDACPPLIVVRRKELWMTGHISADSSIENVDVLMNDADCDVPRKLIGGERETNDSCSQCSMPATRASSCGEMLNQSKQYIVDRQREHAVEQCETRQTVTVIDEHESSALQSPTVVTSASPCSDMFSSRAKDDERCSLSMSTRSSCEVRLTIVEQFKAARLEVLTSMSQLLKAVASTEDNFSTKTAQIMQLCSFLKISIDNFISFVQLLLHKLPQKDDMMHSQVKLFLSVQSGIDGYLENFITTPSSNNAGAQLAGIIQITKDIPPLLRTFAPLVERAAQQADERLSQGDECSAKSLKLTVHIDKYKLEENDEGTRGDSEVQKLDDDKSGNPTKIVNNSVHCELTTVERLSDETESPRRPNAVDNDGSGQNLSVELQPSPNLVVSNSNESLNVEPPTLPPKQKSISVATNDVDTVTRTAESSECSDPDENKENGDDCVGYKQCEPNNACDRLLSVSQTDVSSGAVVDQQHHYEPVMRRKPDDYRRISQSELETPDVRASGVSQTVVDQLEELRRQADSQNVCLHTDYTQFNDFDASVNLIANQLSDNDRRLLMFYCSQMTNNWNVLDNAAGAFFHCMERKQSPKVFVMHSKFVILAGHKMAYIGDVLAKNIEDENAQEYIVAYSNKLCDSLKTAIKTTKEAALKFPDIPTQQMMVDCIKEVTDWAIELKEVIDRLVYLGRPEHVLS